MSDEPLVLAARTVPYPLSVSDAAREKLAIMASIDMSGAPKPETVEDWENMISFANGMLSSTLPPPAEGTTVASVEIGGVPAFDIRPQLPSASTDRRICLYVHGGGFTIGGGGTGGAMATGFADSVHIHTIGIDYRMPPRDPYPAALDDCVAVYKAVLAEHAAADIVIAGVSAGGNLAAALVLRARDEGLPPPAAVVLLSPEIDLTESGDSFETLIGIDPVLQTRLTDAIELYAGSHDLSHPYLSPLFGDFTGGFPPTFLQCGTRDLFLSNTVRFHRVLRRHGVAAVLHVFEAMPHGGFGAMLEGGLGAAPEDREVYEEVRRFIAELA